MSHTKYTIQYNITYTLLTHLITTNFTKMVVIRYDRNSVNDSL